MIGRAARRPTPSASAGYACAQVVLAALRQVDAIPRSDATGLRDAVRAAGVNTAATFQTILGPIAFDARGDITPRVVTIYAYDSAANDWVRSDEVDAAAER